MYFRTLNESTSSQSYVNFIFNVLRIFIELHARHLHACSKIKDNYFLIN